VACRRLVFDFELLDWAMVTLEGYVVG